MINSEWPKFFNLIGALNAATWGIVCATSPLFVYALSSTFCSLFTQSVQPSQLTSVDLILVLGAVCLLPLLMVDAWRSARAFSGREYPHTMMYALLTLVAAPAWLPRAEAEFGPLVYLAAAVWWPIASFSAVAFVVATAQIDAENRGEEIRLTALTTLYHLGGFLGVALAKRNFPESKAAEEFPSGAPGGVVFIIVALVSLALMKTPPVPGVSPWP